MKNVRFGVLIASGFASLVLVLLVTNLWFARKLGIEAHEARDIHGELSPFVGFGTAAQAEVSEAIQLIRKYELTTRTEDMDLALTALGKARDTLTATMAHARAGEAGKGFAVVAEEVRSLAIRSAEAARTTAGLIEESQRLAGAGVGATEQVTQTLREITSGAGQVLQLVGQVSTAGEQQALGLAQINTAVSQLDRITQSNAANAEESASASEELSAQAGELTEIVGRLERMVRKVEEGPAPAAVERPALPQPAAWYAMKPATDARPSPSPGAPVVAQSPAAPTGPASARAS